MTPTVEAIIRAKFPKHVAACEALDKLATDNRPSRPPTDDETGQAILDTYGRSTKTYRAAVLLACHGYGEQAGMLNRSLFEDMVVAHWIKDRPDAAEKMDRHARLVSDRLREAAHRHRRFDMLDDLPPALARDERDKLDSEFRGPKHWTGRTMDALVKDVENQWANCRDRRLLRQVHDFGHLFNNMLLHHGAPGLAAGVDEGARSRTYRIGPALPYVKEALALAFYAFANTVALVLPSNTLAELNTLFTNNIGILAVFRRDAEL